MDALSAYGSGDEEDQVVASSSETDHGTISPSFGLLNTSSNNYSNDLEKIEVNLTPDVHVDDLRMAVPYQNPAATMIAYNPTYEALYAPVMGPEHPFAQRSLQKNTLAGHVETDAMLHIAFEEQRKTFHHYGYAVDPSNEAASAKRFIGNTELAAETKGATIFSDAAVPRSQERKKRKTMGDASEDPFTYDGPWAGYDGEKVHLVNENPTEAVVEEEVKKKGGDDDQHKSVFGPGIEQTIFHGKAERDFMGRTYMQPPQDTNGIFTSEPEHDCFIPKRLIHTWTGHTKGVSAIRFFPKTAHLILSCSMDSKIKIWDVYHQRNCLRTYMGHSKAVRDICFTNDGTKFLSASYDKYIKLWDTETGKCLGAYTNKRIPYCVKFHPEPHKQHIFLAGCSDKKIVQWDTRSSHITQEYDQHLAAVNTITFIDDNRRFVSTSDDKTIRVWEWDIPVVIKYIAEPSMHSIPACGMHPSGKWWLGQSLDNQIFVYGARDRFRENRKKIFKGHLVAGYACQVNCSPNGRYVISGDSEGKLWFWDWKTCKVVKTLKVHDQVTIGCEWHPHEPSKVATCSWDGTIKLWD